MPPQTPEEKQKEFMALLNRYLSGETLTKIEAQRLYNNCFNVCEEIPKRVSIDTYELY